jgi:hypothetical protein
MEEKEQRKFREIYETKVKSNYNEKNYAEVYKLLLQYRGLENYLTNSEAAEMIRYLFDETDSTLKEIKSSLEKTLDKMDKRIK